MSSSKIGIAVVSEVLVRVTLCSIAKYAESWLSVCMGRSEESKGKCVVIGNIHVLFNPKRGDVKLGQVPNDVQTVHQMYLLWP